MDDSVSSTCLSFSDSEELLLVLSLEVVVIVSLSLFVCCQDVGDEPMPPGADRLAGDGLMADPVLGAFHCGCVGTCWCHWSKAWVHGFHRGAREIRSSPS